MSHNPLWQYSLTVYQRPLVAELCLKLQDDFDADVNILLCAAWLASIGQPLTASVLDELLRQSGEWQQNCLAPMRRARRFLKTRAPADVYQAAKDLELEMESLQQQKLYQRVMHLPALAADAELLGDNLQLYLRVLNLTAVGKIEAELLSLGKQLCVAIDGSPS